MALEQVEEEGDEDMEEEGDEEEEEREEVVEEEEQQVTEAAVEQPAVELDDAADEEYVKVQSVDEEAARREADAGRAAQPLHSQPLISPAATRPKTVAVTESTGAEEKVVDKAPAATTSSAQRMQRTNATQAVVADVQRALWQRQDVWLIALLAFILLIVWNVTRDR